MPGHIEKCAAVLFALLIGDGAIAQTAPAHTPIRIEVPSATNLQFFTLWVALGARLFQQEGLEPNLLADPHPREAGQKLLKGEADVALLQPPMFLGMMAEEKPILLFASLLANEPINLVARRDIVEARGIPLRAPLRERLQAMKGLRIGVAGEPPPRLKALFSSVGMDADRDVALVIIHGADQVQAFAEGKVDALFSHTPYLETVLVRHDGVLIADTSGGEVADLADGQIHALATTREVAGRRPELIAAVTRAIAKAEQLIHADPKATVEAILASGVGRLDRPLIEAIVSVYGPAVPSTPRISLSGIARDAVLYPAHPRAPDFSRTRAADYVAAEFADRLPKEN